MKIKIVESDNPKPQRVQLTLPVTYTMHQEPEDMFESFIDYIDEDDQKNWNAGRLLNLACVVDFLDCAGAFNLGSAANHNLIDSFFGGSPITEYGELDITMEHPSIAL